MDNRLLKILDEEVAKEKAKKKKKLIFNVRKLSNITSVLDLKSLKNTF